MSNIIQRVLGLGKPAVLGLALLGGAAATARASGDGLGFGIVLASRDTGSAVAITDGGFFLRIGPPPHRHVHAVRPAPPRPRHVHRHHRHAHHDRRYARRGHDRGAHAPRGDHSANSGRHGRPGFGNPRESRRCP